MSEERVYDTSGAFLRWLSDSILAAKGITNVLMSLPASEEASMTNLEWIVLYCGLSLAARLDILAAHSTIAPATRQLRRFLDVGHVMRQAVLRLETAAGQCVFEQLAKRAKRLQEWYLERLAQTSIPASSVGSSTPSWNPDMLQEAADTLDGQMISETLLGLGGELGLGSFSFLNSGSFEP